MSLSENIVSQLSQSPQKYTL